jgi:hypothetical protein
MSGLKADPYLVAWAKKIWWALRTFNATQHEGKRTYGIRDGISYLRIDL